MDLQFYIKILGLQKLTFIAVPELNLTSIGCFSNY